MPVESVTIISDLNTANPVDLSDYVSAGAEHIRNVKTAVKSLNTASSTKGAAQVAFFPTGTGAITTRTMQDIGRDVQSVKNFGAVGDGATDDKAAINLAIDWLNASARRRIFFPYGNYLITGTLTAITATDWTIDGGGSRITMSASASPSDTGAVFIIGSAGTDAPRGRLHGFQFSYSNTPNVDHFTVDVVNAADVDVYNINLLSASSALRIGGTTTNASRCKFYNWTGNCNGGEGSDANILIRYASSIHISDFTINGQGGGNSGTKAMLKIVPVSGGLIDTIWVSRVGMQFFTTDEPPASADGKAYGVYIDRTLGDVTNLWFRDCYFDHTTTKAFYFVDTDGVISTPASRNINIVNCRFATDKGGGIHFDLSDANTSLAMRMVNIQNNNIWVCDNSYGIHYQGRDLDTNTNNTKGLNISFNHVQDEVPATSKTYAIVVDSSYFRCIGNQIGTTVDTTGWQTGIRVNHSTNTGFVVQGNVGTECAVAVVSNASTGTYSVTGNV